MYSGLPHSVSASDAASKCRAKPKSAEEIRHPHTHSEQTNRQQKPQPQQTIPPIFSVASGASDDSNIFCGFKSRWIRCFIHMNSRPLADTVTHTHTRTPQSRSESAHNNVRILQTLTKLLHQFSAMIFGKRAARLDVPGQVAARTELKHQIEEFLGFLGIKPQTSPTQHSQDHRKHGKLPRGATPAHPATSQRWDG
jgi:hypothetical protein